MIRRNTLRSRVHDLLQKPSRIISARLRRIAFVCALAIILVGIAGALTQEPTLLQQVDVTAWLLLLLCAPLTIFANSFQFWLSIRLLKVPLRPVDALSVTVFGTAANMLPIPGGSLLRIAALKTDTNTYRDTTLITALVTLSRLGTGLVVAGISLGLLGLHAFAAAALGIGVTILIAVVLALAMFFASSLTWILSLAAVQLSMVTIGGLRIWLAFNTLGEPIAMLQALVIALAGIAATIIGLAPGGLGIAEITAAGIAVLIGLSAGTAFLAATLNRLTGFLVVAVVAVALARYRPPPPGLDAAKGRHLDSNV